MESDSGLIGLSMGSDGGMANLQEYSPSNRGAAGCQNDIPVSFSEMACLWQSSVYSVLTPDSRIAGRLTNCRMRLRGTPGVNQILSQRTSGPRPLTPELREHCPGGFLALLGNTLLISVACLTAYQPVIQHLNVLPKRESSLEC